MLFLDINQLNSAKSFTLAAIFYRTQKHSVFFENENESLNQSVPDIRGCLLEEISRIFVEGMITFYKLKLAVLITRSQKITRKN